MKIKSFPIQKRRYYTFSHDLHLSAGRMLLAENGAAEVYLYTYIYMTFQIYIYLQPFSYILYAVISRQKRHRRL